VGNGTVETKVYVNAVEVFSSTSPTITGAGQTVWSDTQDRGVDTFAVDDVITVTQETAPLPPAEFDYRTMASIGVEFDT
jgi:hypothetical protein